LRQIDFIGRAYTSAYPNDKTRLKARF